MSPASSESDDARASDGRADVDPERVTLEAVYSTYAARVYATIWRMIGDPVLADELTQDVFVRAWRSLSGYRGRSSIGTWLHRLAVRAIADHFRASRRYGSPER